MTAPQPFPGGKELCLLSLDGGGVRGLSALHILKQLMELVDQENPPKPCDYFDLIGGTSTGGLIAIMLGRLRMSVDECMTEYKRLSTRVFTKVHHRMNWKGEVQGRFDDEALVHGIQELLESRGFDKNALLKESPGELGCKTFVCATSKETGDTVVLSSYLSRRRGTSLLNIAKIWEAARATSAASSFFDSTCIGDEGFVDGASGANNPIDELWSEAQDIWREGIGSKLEENLRCLVSIGTGVPTLKPFGNDPVRIGKSLLAIALDTERKHDTFQKHHSSLFRDHRAFRFNVLRGLEDIGLEEADKQGAILAATRRYTQAEDIYDRMEMCARALRDRKWLGQMMQQIYSKEAQPDLDFSTPISPLQSDEVFMSYTNTSTFRAWCGNKISGIRCQPPPNAQWTNASLAVYIINQVRAIQPHYFLNDFEEIDFLLAPVASPRGVGNEYELWMLLLGQLIKNVIQRLLKDHGIEFLGGESVSKFDFLSTARLPLAAFHQFYTVTKYGTENVQASRIVKTFKDLLLARREPILLVLYGSVKTKQMVRALEALAAQSPTRHIKVLLCGELNTLTALEFKDFQLIEADTECKECIQSLYLEGYRTRRDEVAVREPGTNQWIWNHPSYLAWKSAQAGLLCIIGKPGSGKSVLAKTIQEAGIPEETVRVASYWFYSKRKGDRYTSHASLIQTFLYQILKANGSYLPYYSQSYRKDYPQMSTWTVEDMQRVLKCLVEAGNPLFCLIDALDEAENDKIMDMVGDLVFNTPNSRIKFIILSRPLKCFERKSFANCKIILQRENQTDVGKIVDSGLKRVQTAMHSLDSDDEGDGPALIRRGAEKSTSVRSQRRGPNALRSKTQDQEQAYMEILRETLLLRSDGVILWVSLCIEELLKLVRRPVFKLSELRDKINGIPGDMTDFYCRIVLDLQSSLSEEDLIISRVALMWTCGASELGVFHLQELWDALAVSLPQVGSVPEGQDPIVFNRLQRGTWNRFRRALQKLCGPFIEFILNESEKSSEGTLEREKAGPNSIVQLMHQTSTDFLGDRKKAGPLHFIREEARSMVRDGVTRYLTTSFPTGAAIYAPRHLSTLNSIRFWKTSTDSLIAYLEDKKLLHFALQISKRERLGVVAKVAKASEAYLSPNLESCKSSELLSSFGDYVFDDRSGAFGMAESAIVGRLFYLAVTHGLQTAVTNLLDMSTFTVNWWLQNRNTVLNAALLAALDHDMKESQQTLSFGGNDDHGRPRRATSDSERTKSSNYARDKLYPKLRNPASSRLRGLIEAPGDTHDVEVAINRVIDHWRALDHRRVGTVGICALDVKARSKPMRNILMKFLSRNQFENLIFGDRVILHEPVENWPICDFLIAYYSPGFPLEKAAAYAKLRKPFCVNDLPMQMVLWDRRLTLRLLDQMGVPTPDRLEVSRDGGPMAPSAGLAQRLYFEHGLRVSNPDTGSSSSTTSRDISMEDDGDTIVVDGQRLSKPFIEKPVDSGDHQINVYLPKKQGGGGIRLFRKVNNKSSERDKTLDTPRAVTEPGSSYIYEKFLEIDNAEDVKVYAVGPSFCHAETRRSPAVDGIFRRNFYGKELRYITALSPEEAAMASKIVGGFGQTVCGFDIIRSNGKSYVNDINGWSLSKDNEEYNDQCAKVLQELFIREVRKEEPVKGGDKALSSGTVERDPEASDITPWYTTLRQDQRWSLPPTVPPNPQVVDGPIPPPTARWKLKGVSAIYSHGDSTPEQKFQFVYHTKPFLDLLEGHTHEAAVTWSSGLQRLQSALEAALDEGVEDLGDLARLKDLLSKSQEAITEVFVKPVFHYSDENLAAAKEQTGAIEMDHAGPEGLVRLSGSSHDPIPHSITHQTGQNNSPFEAVQLILQVGNQPTHALRYQARDLGESCRNEYFLLNPEILDEVHIFCSSERAVSTTASIFAFAISNDQDVPVSVREDLLNDSVAAEFQLNRVNERLKLLVRRGEEAIPQFAWPANMPEPFLVWSHLVDLMKMHREAMLNNFLKLPSGNDAERSSMLRSIQPRWCTGEDANSFKERWENIFTKFCDSAEIFPSHIIELYDNLKYDAIHNRQFLEWCFDSTVLQGDDASSDGYDSETQIAPEFGPRNLNTMYQLGQILFDYVCPQQYGLTSDEKLEIGLLSSLPLFRQVVEDMEEAQASDDSKAFFYFTKRSHIYTILNCLTEGRIPVKIHQREIAELSSLSSIHFELYENERTNAGDDIQAFAYSIKITLGRGCYAYEPFNVVFDSRHSMGNGPRRDLTGHNDWKEVIKQLRAAFHNVKLPKSFLATNLSESSTFAARRAHCV